MTTVEKARLIEASKVYTSSAYLLIEAANSYMVDVVANLEALCMEMNHGELKQFKIMLDEATRLKFRTEKVTEPLREHKAADFIMNDFDFIYDYFKLLIDRTGGIPDKMTRARALLFNMPSELNTYQK